MIIRRLHDLVVSPAGDARLLGKRFACSLGANGVTTRKREGDAATPAGAFRIERVYFRPDRLKRPSTPLPIAPIRIADGWCDDPGSAAYNQPIEFPFAASAERLRRADRLYNLIAVLDANRRPIRPGCGSAIFMHVARRTRFPTLGCIAFDQDALLWILANWRSDSQVIVAPSHAGFGRSPKSADPTRTDVAPRAMAIS